MMRIKITSKQRSRAARFSDEKNLRAIVIAGEDLILKLGLSSTLVQALGFAKLRYFNGCWSFVNKKVRIVFQSEGDINPLR
jgi:hypothetical protein